MPCFAVLLAFIAPRLLIAMLWLFTHWFDGLFANPAFPILGFFFLPTTLIWYTAVQHFWGGAWGIVQILGLALALSIDVSPASGRRGGD